MLPVLDSMMVAPGFSSPRAAAPRIISSAMRSFRLPDGFMYSSLTRISEPVPAGILFSRTIGVFPMSSSMLS